MARGGCASCMIGGAVDTSTTLSVLLVVGMILVVLGGLIYSDHLVDVKIKTVDKSSTNQYMGYAAVTLGLILLYLAFNLR